MSQNIGSDLNGPEMQFKISNMIEKCNVLIQAEKMFEGHPNSTQNSNGRYVTDSDITVSRSLNSISRGHNLYRWVVTFALPELHTSFPLMTVHYNTLDSTGGGSEGSKNSEST